MFKIEFETNNASFEDNGFTTETRIVLENVWNKISNGEKEGIVRDSNGNTIGKYGFEG